MAAGTWAVVCGRGCEVSKGQRWNDGVDGRGRWAWAMEVQATKAGCSTAKASSDTCLMRGRSAAGRAGYRVLGEVDAAGVAVAAGADCRQRQTAI